MELQIQSMCASSESLLSLLFTSTANGKSAQNMYNLKLSIKSNYRRFQTTRRRNTRRERTKRENERTEQHEKKFASTAEKKKELMIQLHIQHRRLNACSLIYRPVHAGNCAPTSHSEPREYL